MGLVVDLDENLLPSLVFKPWTNQPIVSPCTYYGTLATLTRSLLVYMQK